MFTYPPNLTHSFHTICKIIRFKVEKKVFFPVLKGIAEFWGPKIPFIKNRHAKFWGPKIPFIKNRHAKFWGPKIPFIKNRHGSMDFKFLFLG
jgi:hypothetical protein